MTDKIHPDPTSEIACIHAELTVQESRIHGYGLFAAAEITTGELIGRYEGPKVQEDGIYVLWIDCEEEGIYGIDGRNVLRFTNHSVEPNAVFEGADLIALREISSGEEITFHYGPDWEDLPEPTICEATESAHA